MSRPAQQLVTIAAVALLVCPAFGQARLNRHETRYYILHTDLDGDAVREIETRLSAMAEMYYSRTKSFGGKVTRKLPFYMFSRPQDYYAAGGMPGSAGVFNGERMMAIAGQEVTAGTWHVIQHEGFHQFVHAFIGGDIPIWVNEGLAEFFAQGLYTGDGFVTGVIPPARLERLKSFIRDGKTHSIERMMTTTHMEWNAGLSVVNYDQAWSMVHFLAYGDDGRYQKAFNNFIRDVSKGMRYEHAWRKSFGAGTRAFEKKWRQYWLSMDSAAGARTYAKATVATMTSFFARALSQRQVFESFERFSEAAATGRLKQNSEDWLPPSLLRDALELAPRCGKWEINKRSGRFQIVCVMDDGTRLSGTFKLKKRRVVPESVQVTVR